MKLSSMKQAVVAALEDIKARDIVVLDVRHLTSLFDCMIIASAESTRQTRALANRVQAQSKQRIHIRILSHNTALWPLRQSREV